MTLPASELRDPRKPPETAIIDGDTIQYRTQGLLVEIVKINGREPSLGFASEMELIGQIQAARFGRNSNGEESDD